MTGETAAELSVFLSSLPASPREQRRARIVLLVSLAIFLAAAPFARVKLAEVWAFIPCYQSALLVIDLITAILLFAQLAILRSRALLLLASGYLFNALMAIPHALSFPRLFAPGGLIGAGPQTTAWLYMIWHAGFPIALILYTLQRGHPPLRRPRLAIAGACAGVVGTVIGATLLATAGHELLPVIMSGDGYTPLLPFVTGLVWSLSLVALLTLWRQSAKSVLDIWLIVVMYAWLFDIALSALLNAGRFDLGFYAGRVYGLFAASLVLVVLLLETGALYAQLARSFALERDDSERRLREVHSELVHVSRLSELGQMASTLAHEVNQPLTAIRNYVRGGMRLLGAGDSAKAAEAMQRAADQVDRATDVIQRLRQFVKKEESVHTAEDVRVIVEEAAAIALLGAEGRAVRLELDFAPDTPPVLVDRVQIGQVLLNLMRNAVEAMHGRARRELVVRTLMDSDMVEVRVADTGPGIAPEIRNRLFQPFATTKSSGMGVGLSICRSIIEAHGGTISVTNVADGTEFRFTLPIVCVRT